MTATPRDLPRASGTGGARRMFLPIVAIAAIGGALLAPGTAAASKVPAIQHLVVLLGDHAARTSPSVHAHRIASVAGRRPLTHTRTVLPVVGHTVKRGGHTWIHVVIPGRPAGRKAWITSAATARTLTTWHLVLAVNKRRLTVYRDGVAQRHYPVVVGAPSTPTPRGEFFIEEAVAVPYVGGPFALATSARSHVLQEFEGGPGQIALHGTNGLSGAPGTAASHGCIRMSTSAITWLSRRIGSGVPLTITR
jgi:lipoprotein-anchoring transpeptidase ErfK/SrfK